MNNEINETKKGKFLQNKYLKYGLVLVIGLFLGWLFFGGSGNSATGEHTHEHAADETIWTCSMHPQIRQDKPGLCPLCAMDLTPLVASSGEGVHPDAIQLSEEAIALSNVQTSRVSRQNPVKEIQLYGTIQIDERLSQSQTSHINGRVEKLLVNFTGESVRQGQTLAVIYSPDLVNAQQELLEAAKLKEIQPALLDAAREKLRFWKLTDEQIEAIEKSGKVNPNVEIKSNTSGVIINKNVSQGDYINQGSVLFTVANLSQVWALFDAYESDLPFLNVGDNLDFQLQAIPGKTFSGKISFIDPILDRDSRTSKVRVVTSNAGMQLKPEMYASAKVSSPLKQHADEIVIPKSAVLWTGKRSLVYIKDPEQETPTFMMREIELGPSLGNAYVVLAGLENGEEIVTNGAFTLDATAQLEGKKSMMNQGDEEKILDSSTTKGELAVLKVGGACEMCTDRIEKTAKGVIGVYAASYNLETQELKLDINPHKTSPDAVSKAIAAVGHDTDRHKAADAVYEALPACCHYRK